MTLVVYDIVDDRIRGKIHGTCKDYGLVWRQYSFFAGRIPTARREDLFDKLTDILGEEEGKIFVIPISKDDVERMLTVVNGKREDRDE